ncbi:MAG TPA: addiction module protein [Bryobacteraceae bacterium]|jgi:putative addiction module component (TIGR02574 family)|nr:addiction module protein [Bryobacteraceae bacterium]
MQSDPAELLRNALTLPAEARAALIDSLLDSLDTEVDPEAEDAWRVEIQRRVEQIASGTVTLLPCGEARRRLARAATFDRFLSMTT